MTDGTAANAIRTALWHAQAGHTDSFQTELAWSARDALDNPDTPVNRVIVADYVCRAYLVDPSPETLALAARLIEAQPTPPPVDETVFEGLTS